MSNNKDFKVKNGIQPTSYYEGVGTVVSATEGYNLAGASYDSKSFSVNAQEGSPEGLYFKSDGTKVYVVGSSGDSVDQFSLSTAWDISTASFDSVTFSLASQVTTPKGIFFKPDGTSFYVQGQSVADRYVYQYNMTTAWNISTASYASKSFSTSEDNEPLGVFFKPDGTKAFVTGEQNDKVYQYGLSTAWDASTGSYDSVSFDFSATANYVHGLAFSSDGTKLFLAGYNTEYKIFSYALSTAWDLTTASYVTSFSINSQETNNKDVQFSTDGTKMYIIGATHDTIFQYSTALLTNTLDLSTGSVFDLTPTSDSQITLSNPAASGTVSQATLLLGSEDATGVGSTFSTALYTGTGSAQTITNGIDLAGDGGMVWIKDRSSATAHSLVDSERGVDYWLRCNTVEAQISFSGNSLSPMSFNSNGFTTSNYAEQSYSGHDFVSWTFKKQTKFFDIVTYTGNGTAGRTVSHNLGSVPGMIIVKKTSDTDFWTVYHRGTDATSPEDYWLNLNGTGAASSAANMWNGTAPTSTEFTVSAQSNLNGNGSTYVAYLFAHDTDASSIIKCGNYTGNGNDDGPVIDLGFEPQWLMIKNTTDADNWWMLDTMRGMAVDAIDPALWADSNNAEVNTGEPGISPTPTGFKVTTNQGFLNNNNANLIYMAIRNSFIPTITYNPDLQWSTGTAPTAPAIGETDVITFSTTDGGTSYQAVQAIDGAK